MTIKVGTRFIATGTTGSGDVTPGQEYVIAGWADEGPYFIDDAGEENWAMEEGGWLRLPGNYTIIELGELE